MEEIPNRAVVPPENDGQRLDQALASLFPGSSRSFLARLVEERNVRINGAVAAKKSVPVRAGDEILLEVPPPRPSGLVSQDIPISLLYEDEALLVLVKPPGLVVHPAAGHDDGTLVNAVLHHASSLSGIGGELRPGIVHRLDKDTSGVMVVAKSDLAHRRLTEAWGTELVRKEYLALVYGKPKRERGTVDAPIGRDPRDRKRMAIVAGGRRAVTLYEVVARYPYLALLRCTLKTGRTHQIRVHLKSIGHPIVGDPLYSGPQWKGIPDKRLQRLLASFPRQALHAALLSFPHPITGETMTFEAPLPEDMAELIASIAPGRDPGQVMSDE